MSSVYLSYSPLEEESWASTVKVWLRLGSIETTEMPYSTDTSTPGDSFFGPIERAMQPCFCTLLLVGEQTYLSEWCRLTIEIASRQRKPLLALKLDPSFVTPKALYGSGVAWIQSFSEQDVVTAVQTAREGIRSA